MINIPINNAWLLHLLSAEAKALKEQNGKCFRMDVAKVMLLKT